MAEHCDIRWRLCASGGKVPGTVSVNENMDDGSWRITICQPCADVLGIKEGDDMPDNATELLEGD